jgi:thymidine kinase
MNNACGRLTVITGCMFSGKTTELLNRLALYPSGSWAGFKHAMDRRYHPTNIVTHPGRSVPAVAVSTPGEILAHLRDGLVALAIDDAHFFDDPLEEVILTVRSRRIDVSIAALDLDSWGRPFRLIACLAGLAEERLPKFALCARCGAVADHTHRLTPIVHDQLVGGPESYEPRCSTCWRPPR